MSSLPSAGVRGPVEHERREQIISAANEYFRHYGYEKTTVADLAKAIGVSKAYIYKFFDSKQAIGEAVCSGCLAKISGAIEQATSDDKPAVERLRNLFKTLARECSDLFFHDRRMHDLAATSSAENWQSYRNHLAKLRWIVETIIQAGRQSGEFERKTPLNEIARAIMLALEPFQHPVLLQHMLDTVDDDAVLSANMVLRSLAP